MALDDIKVKRGWWFSVGFMLLVMGLIVFLAMIEIVEKNRDIIIGIVGMLTGSISSMIAIASGRDPAEVDALKEELSKKEADRAALIARLRDANIQMQLYRDQLSELQHAIITHLSHLKEVKQRLVEDVELNPQVQEWLPAQPEPSECQIDEPDKG